MEGVMKELGIPLPSFCPELYHSITTSFPSDPPIVKKEEKPCLTSGNEETVKNLDVINGVKDEISANGDLKEEEEEKVVCDDINDEKDSFSLKHPIEKSDDTA